MHIYPLLDTKIILFYHLGIKDLCISSRCLKRKAQNQPGVLTKLHAETLKLCYCFQYE